VVAATQVKPGMNKRRSKPSRRRFPNNWRESTALTWAERDGDVSDSDEISPSSEERDALIEASEDEDEADEGEFEDDVGGGGGDEGEWFRCSRSVRSSRSARCEEACESCLCALQKRFLDREGCSWTTGRTRMSTRRLFSVRWCCCCASL
jgi:hypothetical protein